MVDTNDNFTSSIALSGTNISSTGTNVGFSGESEEPNHAGVSDPLNSAWWNWTAPSSGTVTLNTNGSDYDTTLGVYTGSALNSLSQVASDDDSGTGLQSLVGFTATAGTTYQIAVDGYNGSTGNIDLNLDFVSNDNFANSIALSGTDISTTGTNVGFTGESEEPNHAGVSDPLNSAWWNWTAPSSGTVTLNTNGSDYDTTLGVYTGSALNSLSQVASDDDSGTGLQSLVGFTATAGTTYQIAVDGYNGSTGNIDLNLDFVSNDNFANSIALSGTDISTTGTNVGFTGESGEPNHAGVSDTLNSAWWNWTAPTSGTVTLNTFGSDYDTVLGVYTGSAVDSLSEVGSNDDFGSLQSQVVFDAIAGTTYQIAVDGYFSSTGNIDLNLDLVAGFSTGESMFGTPDDNGLTVNALGTDPASLTGIQANTLSSNSLVFV